MGMGKTKNNQMKLEIDIKELCDHLTYSLRDNAKVEYFNGIRPANYFTPQLVTTKMAALSGEAVNHTLAWYAEIFIDGVCIFRESTIPTDQKDEISWEFAAESANKRLIASIFCYGVWASKESLKTL